MPNVAIISINTVPDAYALKKSIEFGCIISLNSSVMKRHANVKTTEAVTPTPDSKTTPTSRLHLRNRLIASPMHKKTRAGRANTPTIHHFTG
jgi:hypothetical protein